MTSLLKPINSLQDAFREAKANGFSVTVIRNGQIKLNVDQTLEEVEEEITEIGSKFYHDKIMHERSVDINTLMKGVDAAEKSTKKGSINTLMKGVAAAEKSTKRYWLALQCSFGRDCEKCFLFILFMNDLFFSFFSQQTVNKTTQED